MVEISIHGDQAVFEVLASHKVWAFKSKLQIPLSHISGARLEPNPPLGWFDAIKWVGTDLPHLFRAGTFFTHEGRVFFDVRHPEKTIIVDLKDEEYKHLVIEVEDPSHSVDILRAAIQNSG